MNQTVIHLEDSPNSIRTLLRAILSDGSREPSPWSLLVERLGDLDQLTPFEQTTLPMLVDRWQKQGHDLENIPILRGLRRKMIVRNRLLLAGAEAAMNRLHTAGIDTIALKGVALIGRGLPATGLRAIADIDLWVRPSQHAAAGAVCGAQPAQPLRGAHAATTLDSSGRELDLHIVPSHLFALQRRSPQAAEALFERTWQQRVANQPALADVIYLSFLNPLFTHAPGEPRAAFALIELDAVLTSAQASQQLRQDVVAKAIEDNTVAIFVEHLAWLGPGASATLDRFHQEQLEPVLTPTDRAVLRWIDELQHRPGFDPTYRQELRALAYARGSAPQDAWTMAQSLVGTHAQAVWSKPWLLAAWLVRPRSWRRLQQLIHGLFNIASPIRPRINGTSPPEPPAPDGRTPPP
jgi:hypothetical protein